MMLPRCRIGTAVIIALCRANVTNKSDRHRQRVTFSEWHTKVV